jgi:triosephosphate isomerase
MKKLLAFNWKMNPTSVEEVDELLLALKHSLNTLHSQMVQVFPPYVFLGYVQQKLYTDKIYAEVGSQDVFYEEKGAFTGNVSAKMLKSLNVGVSIVGHSETRNVQRLTDSDVNRKLAMCFENGLAPILCVGHQSKKDKEKGEVDYNLLKKQVIKAIEGLEDYVADKGIIIAYEPVWAIGTGKVATPEIVATVALFIKKSVAELIGQEAVEKVKVLYGGSVDDTNIDELKNISEIEGFLVGGASLKPEKFQKMIQSIR